MMGDGSFLSCFCLFRCFYCIFWNGACASAFPHTLCRTFATKVLACTKQKGINTNNTRHYKTHLWIQSLLLRNLSKSWGTWPGCEHLLSANHPTANKWMHPRTGLSRVMEESARLQAKSHPKMEAIWAVSPAEQVVGESRAPFFCGHFHHFHRLLLSHLCDWDTPNSSIENCKVGLPQPDMLTSSSSSQRENWKSHWFDPEPSRIVSVFPNWPHLWWRKAPECTWRESLSKGCTIFAQLPTFFRAAWFAFRDSIAVLENQKLCQFPQQKTHWNACSNQTVPNISQYVGLSENVYPQIPWFIMSSLSIWNRHFWGITWYFQFPEFSRFTHVAEHPRIQLDPFKSMLQAAELSLVGSEAGHTFALIIDAPETCPLPPAAGRRGTCLFGLEYTLPITCVHTVLIIFMYCYLSVCVDI